MARKNKRDAKSEPHLIAAVAATDVNRIEDERRAGGHIPNWFRPSLTYLTVTVAEPQSTVPVELVAVIL